VNNRRELFNVSVSTICWIIVTIFVVLAYFNGWG
jgi:hypothetical protein